VVGSYAARLVTLTFPVRPRGRAAMSRETKHSQPRFIVMYIIYETCIDTIVYNK
jgi:hypothetical protein